MGGDADERPRAVLERLEHTSKRKIRRKEHGQHCF